MANDRREAPSPALAPALLTALAHAAALAVLITLSLASAPDADTGTRAAEPLPDSALP